MPLENHTLAVGFAISVLADLTIADGRTLAAWGATKCVVTTKLGGEDSLSLTIPRPLDGGPLFNPFAPCVLFAPSGVRVFAGILTKASFSATGSSETRTYIFEGPSYWLSRIVFRQMWLFATNPLDFATSYATIAAELASDPAAFAERFQLQPTSRVILFYQLQSVGADGTIAGYIFSKLTIPQQLKAILDYAQAANFASDGEAPFGGAIDGSAPIRYNIGPMADIDPPTSEELDMRCTDALGRVLRWAPHIKWRWDYAGGAPVCNIQDVAAGGFGGQTLDRTGSAAAGWMIELEGSPRADLLCPGVELTYLYGTKGVDATDPTSYFNVVSRHLDRSALVSNGSYGIARSTIQLSGAIANFGGGHIYTTDGEPVPAAGLADSLHTAYARPYYEVRFTKAAAEVDWSLGCGQQWNVTGADPEYAGAGAICQTIVRDIGAGTTRVECGPPEQQGLGTRLEIIRANRLRKVSGASGEMQNGLKQPGDPGDPAPGGGGGTVTTILVDATTATAHKYDVQATLSGS